MSEQNVMNRWLVVLGAILIQLALGAIYAWSVFTPALRSEQPYELAAIYSSYMLQVDAEVAEGMEAQMKAPLEELKTLETEIKVADDESLKALKAEKETLETGLNEVVVASVGQERLDTLTYGFNKTQAQIIFAAGLFFFAVVMVIAGRMMPKVGPRNLAILSGLVLGAGYALAGLLGGQGFYQHLFFIGVIGGSGIGLGYVVPIAVAMRWFPDKKGMITGLAVAGFGFGALLWIKLAGGWGDLIEFLGLPTTFLIYGIAFAAMVIVGGLFMTFPPEGWLPAGYTPPEAKKAADGSVEKVDFTSGQMLVRPQYYMLLFMFIFGASAGLMSIGLMKSYPLEALFRSGKDLAAASAIAGTAMGVFFSLANGIGRIAWGTISDFIGRKPSMFIMMAVQGVVVICFQFMAGNEYLLYVGATLIGFNFGGNFALFPAMTTDTFGAKHIGQNYGWVFLGYGFGGIFGPIMGGYLGDLGIFPLAFTICGVLCLVAAVLALFLARPRLAAASTASELETAEQTGGA